jgi:thiol:disulfide interchange protein DsbC
MIIISVKPAGGRAGRGIVQHLSAVAASLVLAAGAVATERKSPDVDHAAIAAALTKAYPALAVQAVHDTPWSNVFEVVVPDGLMYTDASGSFVLQGPMMHAASRENLTDARWQQLNRIEFAELPFASAIKTVRGNGDRRMAVFADPDCPFCKRLEQELQHVDNVTVYTFLYPIETLHPGATRKSAKIWCAPDPRAAWEQWMLRQSEPTSEPCDDGHAAELAALADQLRVFATPTMFFEDGRRLSGAVDRERIETELRAAAK